MKKLLILLALLPSVALAQDQWANNASSTLASSITSGSTSIVLHAGDGALFPTPGNGYWLTIESGSLASPTAREIVRVSARSSDTLTVSRGRQGTTASAFAAGSRVSFRVTKTALESFAVTNMPELIRTSSAVAEVGQSHLKYKPWYYLPFGAGSTTVDTLGSWTTAGGTATARSITSGSLINQSRRLAFVSGTSANNSAGVRANNVAFCMRSTTTGLGGCRMTARFVLDASLSNQRVFCGYSSTLASTILNSDPTAQTNAIGIALNTGDTAFRFMQNDGSGTATSISLGSSFPGTTSNTDFYEFNLLIPIGPSARAFYSLDNLSSGAHIASYVDTDLPATNTGLGQWCGMATPGGGAVTFTVMSFLAETPY